MFTNLITSTSSPAVNASAMKSGFKQISQKKYKKSKIINTIKINFICWLLIKTKNSWIRVKKEEN